MTYTKRNSITLIFCIVFVAIAICGCSKSGKNTDLSSGKQKFVGSVDTPGVYSDMDIFKHPQEIIEKSPLIVIAHYTDTPQIIEEELSGKTYYASQYHLQVEEVLKGECEDTILFWQTGKPDSDNYETKIKKGQRYILFLTQKPIDSAEPIYDAVGVEQGILEINANDTLYSYFDYGIMPSFDGEPAESLVQEVESFTK